MQCILSRQGSGSLPPSLPRTAQKPESPAMLSAKPFNKRLRCPQSWSSLSWFYAGQRHRF